MMRHGIPFAALMLLVGAIDAAETCPTSGLALRPVPAADVSFPSAYLVYLDGVARAAINVGTGSAAVLSAEPTVEAVFLTNLHAEQTGDLPMLVARWKATQHRPVTIFGPSGSRTLPSTTTFIRTLFDGTRGAFRYLGEVVNPLARDGFRLRAHDIANRRPRLTPGSKSVEPEPTVWHSGALTVHAASTGSTALPSLAYGLNTGTQYLAVIDYASELTDPLSTLVAEADLVVARVKAKTPDGPALSVKNLAAALKGGKVRELAVTGVTESTATPLAVSSAGPAKLLASRDCWSPTPRVPR